MNRRDLIRQLLAKTSTLAGAILCTRCQTSFPSNRAAAKEGDKPLSAAGGRQLAFGQAEAFPAQEPLDYDPEGLVGGEEFSLSPPFAPLQSHPDSGEASGHDHYHVKMRDFDRAYPGDIYIPASQRVLMSLVLTKLNAVQQYVGHGHFNLVSFDEALLHARRAAGLEPFTRDEVAFIEEVFHFDASLYGFLGKKLVPQISARIAAKDVVKVAFSGHYLYRDVSLPIYERIVRDVGNSLILTSGVRGVLKQMQLFLAKVASVHGNYSQASRSLAPPGHSYHAVGDFDVGKRGLGTLNFTAKFSETDEYKKLTDLGYIDIRYPFDNPFGVRFEPWHILGVERRV